MNKKIKLGDKVKDKVSGFEGIATAKTIFLNGCLQIEVTPKIKEGEPNTSDKLFGIGIDIEQLEKIGNGINISTKKPIKKNIGGRMRRVSRSMY